MNLMLRTVGGKATPAPEEKRQREREVVKKILEENDKFRTRMGFFDLGEPRPDQTVDIAKHLHIYPDEIIFKDIQENQTYEINIMVRNLTKAVKRIRVLQPTTKKFRCDYDMAGLLAPGLAIELVVSFSTSVSGQFHDKIVILSDLDYRCEVPLHAYSPMANIIFEPFVNMGFIQVGQLTKYKMIFTNKGTLDGTVELRYSDLPEFKIEPKANFKVKGEGGQHEIELIYQPKEAGIFRGIIEVYQEGQAFMNHIDVNATSVEFLKFIVDTDGNELSKVDFGSVFFGQKREIKGFLVNNSPKPFKFKVNYMHGLHNNYDEEINLKTPAEEGHQQTQRVMTISPCEGVIDTYSQMPVTFYCHSKVQEDHTIWVRNNCFRKTKAEPKIMQSTKKIMREEELDFDDKSKKNHDYTAIFQFDDQEDKKMLMMTATCICPKVSFGEESHFDFGTIRANETEVKTIDVSNMHTNMDVVIDFPNVSVFFVEPSRITLKAGEKKTIRLIFRPRSLGKFIRKVDFMINKKFNVPITLVGIASQIALKNKKPVGPLQVDFDTYSERKYLEKMQTIGDKEDTEQSHYETKQASKGFRDGQKGRSKTAYPYKPNARLMKVADTTHETQLPHLSFGNTNQENFADHQIQKHNTKVANDYLTDQRKDRELMKKRGYIVGQNKMRKDRIGYYTGKSNATTTDGFYTTTRQEKLESPNMNIPLESDTLFVMKPISTYEPYPMYDLSANFSPDIVTEKPYPEKPDNHAESRDITSELTGEELQKIQVGPTVIDFGSIYQKSTEIRFFQIKNDLRKPIMAKLSIDNNTELIDSYQKTQVIPSGKTASFQIVFCSLAVMLNYSKLITYTINDKHQFKINVKADVTTVNLKLSKTDEEFIFEDEQLDMQLVKEIQIRNDGNATGCFEWRDSKTGCFVVEPKTGEVEARSVKTVKVIYTPSGTKQFEEDDLIMNILDGQHEVLSCRANLNEVKCEFSNKVIDFGIMCVSERRLLSTLLNNDLMKSSVVFQVDTSSLPPGLEISPMNDRIPPGNPIRFELLYCNPNVAKLQNREVKINLRGAPPALLYINAETIIPNVRIKEEEFNFGEVTFGNTESMKMTLINESEIDIVLTLDLREQEAIKESELYSRLDIKYNDNHEGEDDQVLEEKDLDDIARTEFKSIGEMNHDEPGDENSEEEANQREVQQSEGSRFFSIKLKKKKTYEFELRFSPKLGQKNPYSFNLPISLAGFEPLSLKRRVHCRGIFQKLTMEPINGEVVFEKKIITSLDAVVPQHASITFTNSQQSKPLHFKIDTSVLEKREIFSVIPVEGDIDPQVPVTIKVSFKPQGNEKYQEELPLYIEGETKPYTTIKLIGEGAYPKLLFDRREVIMPIVPLGIESKCSFKIENEGYQNLILKHYLAQDIGAIKLKVETPEGKTIGSGTNVIRVDLSFTNDKPISFTTKLIFEDESKQIYPIFVSGTTDNSILTNYPFFQVKGDEYRPVAEANKPIKVEVTDMDMDSQLSPLAGGNFHSRNGGSVGSKSMKSDYGFSPIRMDDLERSCRHCRDWLNSYVLSIDMENYPADVIESNGKEIYELIAFLTKRNPPQLIKIDPTMKKQQRVEQLHKQYSDLLRHLKEAGAMLNTIRPEYLLSQSELTTYYKKNYNQYALPHANRISSNHFKYLSLDAWSTLFYQILKVYYECRVTPKVFKAMKELPTNQPLLPEFCQEPNQIYNQAELILLRWIELAVTSKYKSLSNSRPINFEGDIRSGIGIGCLLHMYLEGPTSIKKVLSTRATINSLEDMKYNFEKIRIGLREYGISQPPEVFDFEPSAREFVVYLLHLFQVLPYFIPRSTLDFPVMLKGTCVRTILLNNNSKRKICYSVKLDCTNEDFSIEKSIVEIEPGASISFPVKYFARISRPNNARITFRNKRETGPQATPLAFDLISEVQGRHNEEIIKVEEDVQLYEPIMIEIPVKNPYNQQVTFNIKIENVPMVIDEGKKKRIGRKGTQDDRVFIPAFFCKQDTMQIGKQATGKLHLHYVPVTLEQHKCHIVFTDERVGEMQYEIQGEPKMPAPMPLDQKSSKVVCQLDNLEPIKLDITRHNTKMEFAFSKLKEKVRESKTMPAASKTEILKKIDSVKDNLTFYLECSQPYVQVPTTFTLNSGKRQQDLTENSRIDKTDALMSVSETSNQLQINLLYKFPVQNQPATIMLRNSTRTDVRIYELEITVSPKKVRALLEMTTPARIPITQNIPLINSLDTDVNVRVTIERTKNGEAFKLDVTESIPFKVTKVPYQLNLTYQPEWTNESHAKMIVNYKETNEIFEYELRGKGEEPLAEKEYIIDCKLKEEKIVMIEFDDVKRPNTTYQVEIDLPHYATGPGTFDIHAGKTGSYPLKIHALLGGEFTGSVTFKNDQGMYWWYMITLKVESSKFERHLDMSTYSRKAIVQEIELENPINEAVNFKVSIDHENLAGNPSIAVPARGVAKYQLTFLPLSEFKEKTSVTFMNQKIGDVIYEIQLDSDMPPQVKLNTVRCEVGKTEKVPITLTNVIKETARVTARALLSQNFFLENDQFIIPPMGSITVNLLYTPTDLDKQESVHIVFESKDIGSWSYKAIGIGIPPTKFPETKITGSLNKQSSNSIVFKNPFRDRIAVSINLEAEGSNKEVFELVMKKNKETIAPLQSIDLSFNFLPQEITDYKAEIVVQMNDKIAWRFPILAVTESVNHNSNIKLLTKCHQRLDLCLQLKLPGVTNIKPQEQFEMRVVIANKEINPILDKWIEKTAIKNHISHTEDKLRYEIKFLPHKPFKSIGEIIIIKPSGGRWRFRVYLDSTIPEPDHTVTIESSLNQASQAMLKLNLNHTGLSRYSRDYRAEYTPDSATEFTVTPKQGPISFDDPSKNFIVFTIGYTSVEYGRVKIGKLVIQTAEYYWSFVVKGSFPKYKPKKIESSMLDNHLDPKYAQGLGKAGKKFQGGGTSSYHKSKLGSNNK